MTRKREDILDDDPITLKEASEVLLRGIVSVSALRSEVRRGNLIVERIGKNLFTTPAHIREMRRRCRVQSANKRRVPCAPACAVISSRPVHKQSPPP
jgi:hypothetical protein